MKNRISLVLGSLVGAVAIHGALVACTAGSTSGYAGVPGAEGTANAQTAPAASVACSQWEIRTVTPTKFGWTDVHYVDTSGKPQTTSVPSLEAMTLDTGWEPIGALYYSPMVRRCIK